jgi:hypothetical protein
MEENNTEKKKGKGGRNPKLNPAIYRYAIRLDAHDNAKFLSLFEQSGMSVKAHFITSCLFNKTIKVVKIDKAAHDYYMRLTTFYSQFRSIGVNYNQIIKALKSNFTEKKALLMLYKLEQETIKLIELTQKIIALTQEFEEKCGREEVVVKGSEE